MAADSPTARLTALAPYIRTYRADLEDAVIPFWLRHSLDHEYGGYFSCLDRRGRVFDSRKYVWLQGRGVWTFARLHGEYGGDPAYLDAARLGYDFLRRYAFDAQGRAYFSLTREGVGSAYQRKPFSLAFAALGLLEYGRATGDDEPIDAAEDMFTTLRRQIADPGLLGRTVGPGHAPMTSLPEQLMVLTIALQLARLRPSGRYHDVALAAAATMASHRDADHAVLMDHRSLAADRVESPEERLLNPGHAIESAWQLMEAAELLGDAGLEELALSVLDASLRMAWDPAYGGLSYLVDVTGAPTLQIEATMKLWWTHAEALVALVLAYARTGSPRWLRWLDDVHRYTYDHFVDRRDGEWFGYLDRSGRIANDCKGGPYKGFYHVPRALLRCVVCYDELLARPGPA